MCDVEIRLKSGSPLMGVGIAATTCDDGRNQSGPSVRGCAYCLTSCAKSTSAPKCSSTADVAFEAVRRELAAMRLGDAFVQVADEFVGAHGVTLADNLAPQNAFHAIPHRQEIISGRSYARPSTSPGAEALETFVLS